MKRLVLTLAILAGIALGGVAQNIWKPINGTGLLGVGSDGSIYAYGEYGTLSRSQDEGETWQIVLGQETGFTGHINSSCFAVSPEGRICVFNDNLQTVVYSDDNGDTWQQTTVLSLCGMPTKAGICAPTNDIMVVWAANGEISYTLDGGETWDGWILGFLENSESVSDLLVNDNGDVYVSVAYYLMNIVGIYHSTLSDIQNWELVAAEGISIKDMAFDPEGNVVACGYNVDGSSIGFQQIPGFFLFDGTSLAISDEGIVYTPHFMGLQAVLAYSTDHGEHFTEIGEHLPLVDIAPGGDNPHLFKGYDNHLYFDGGGEYWKCIPDADEIISQNGHFAPQGAEWYFNIFSFMNSPITYYRMAVEGDTLIQGHQCSVITRQYLGGNGDKQYVYEENDKVYWYNATLDAFTTLYDFDAEEGESWICHIDSCSYEVTVQSVEQVTWGGRTYRVQNIASVEGDFYERIIEGIGSVKGLFPYTYTCGGNIYCGPYPDYLRCYLVDGEMLYHEGDLECDAVLPWQYPCWDGTVAEAYDGGNGTAEDPYQIATPQQLALLAQQTNDGTGGDAYYLLTDDICLNANLEMWYINWKPIGRVTDSAVANFKGHFDGNGKTISKLLCETNEMMTDPVIGLFGCTDGAEIVNVNLSDCRLTGGEYAGGLVGYAGSTHISNCSVQNSQITTTGGVAGGIVGYAGMPFGIYEINENVSIITNCEINLVTVESSVDAGGIVGKVNDDSYYARYLISNCNANNEQYFHVKGSVSGGIVGEMSYGTIKGCASKTIVVGTGQVSNVCVGGIAGSIHGSTVIANSYNRGNVVADFEFAGGIVGYSAGNVYNVYNAGEIHMPDPNSSGYGTIIGNVQAGERLNCYWLENDLPSAGNPIQPDMPGSTAFHQGSTSTSWMLNEPQYDTSDLLEALNLGQHDDYLWLEDVDMANGGLPIPVQIEPGLQLNGSEWYYEILNADGSITYQYMYQAGDTIVQDEPTHILVKINTLYDKGEHQEVTHEYVYERDGKVYWWNKALDEFTVLYDLDAQQGDSWAIKVGTESLTMHVDAVEQYEYEGRIYKMLQVSDEGDIFSGMIVCGIGHLTSFFPERLMNRGKGFRVEGIRCYWRDSELVFKYGDKDCNEVYQEYHIGIEEDGPSTGSGTFTVYPNPTNGVLTIHHSAFIIQHSTFRITNLMGQTLLTGQITSDTQQIDVTNLPEGMYFITIAGETRKVVVR